MMQVWSDLKVEEVEATIDLLLEGAKKKALVLLAMRKGRGDVGRKKLRFLIEYQPCVLTR